MNAALKHSFFVIIDEFLHVSSAGTSLWTLVERYKQSLRPCPHYCVFVVIENGLIESCPHFRFDAFLTVHTKMLENDRIARCDVSWTLCACYKLTHAPAIFSVFVFMLIRFRPSTITEYVCVFVLIHSQERFQIDAFSMKTLSVLVWMEGLNALKCVRF